jgi:hypothetical protein
MSDNSDSKSYYTDADGTRYEIFDTTKLTTRFNSSEDIRMFRENLLMHASMIESLVDSTVDQVRDAVREELENEPYVCYPDY